MLPDYFGLYGHHDSWPLPHFLPHPAQTHCGSGICEKTACGVLIMNPETTTPDNTNTAISTE
jgi:hypothetical protein